MKTHVNAVRYRILFGSYMVSIVMAAIYVIIGCSELGGEAEDIERVKNINPFSIERIAIYEKLVQQKHENLKILEIHEQFAIDRFVSSLRSLKKVDPNHPQFPNMWLIKIKYKDENKDFEELLVLQRRGYPKRLYIEFSPHGLFGITEYVVSFDLYRWMEEEGIFK